MDIGKAEMKKYQGLLAALVVLLLAYPAVMLGQHIGNMSAELPQAFRERPLSMLVGLVLNVLIVGTVTWAICIRKRPSDFIPVEDYLELRLTDAEVKSVRFK